MENTVVGVYDSYAQAQNAMNELLSAGFSRSDVQLSPESDTTGSTTTTTHSESGSGIGNFFRSLFGMEEHREHGDVYSEAVRRGSCVLTVNAASDDLLDRATQIMNRYDPVDIDERTSNWKNQGWSGYDAAAPVYTSQEIEDERSRYGSRTDTLAGSTQNLSDTTSTTGETRIPIVEEQLAVGKRAVQSGGVRIFKRVRETPVNESVTLRQEHVHVERHAVNQPATEADLAAFKEGSVELREMSEEAVVGKSARVVEEVVIGKDVTQEKQTITDTVRRTEVEVQQLGAGDVSRTGTTAYSGTGADDSDFRSHWQSAYGQSGGRYEDYDSAYRYGHTMAGSDRFTNYRWEDAEPTMRSDWESKNPGSAWDKVKDAVRYGAERVSGNNQSGRR